MKPSNTPKLILSGDARKTFCDNVIFDGSGRKWMNAQKNAQKTLSYYRMHRNRYKSAMAK
jgi:hypothetical protein